ncbi:hypothetical protein SPOG_01854 [Schizosaccharomyces cryophilus OY26]|uniref:Uncharacterized protein n=1 Tax=Schizosaccharomyces cryophilus (strain OY26 / ATCC MYA-4695 / CBS 11777 / NBRC 106824 / NRRL Y48691) TaxID=653667 RepID=S9X604_SCHCR|nr:uncharacterized protein SPOG_01854 [Schizosaccharomyces cryophilus OY26]EPY52532.1 hypothetical protein SPOG_01854 [Schizosaccharomyces cryophilus OY26]
MSKKACEIWVGDVRDYKAALRLSREDGERIIVYDFFGTTTRNYLFWIDFEDERPYWQLVARDAILVCYNIICQGGEFTEISFPGLVVTRRPDELQDLHD